MKSSLIALFLATSLIAQENDKVTQFSVVPALNNGVTETEFTLKDLTQHGDFAIGIMEGGNSYLIGYNNEYFESIKGKGFLEKELFSSLEEIGFFQSGF